MEESFGKDVLLRLFSPFPRNGKVAELAFSVHHVHFKDIKVRSVDDPPIAVRAVRRVMNMTWDISDVNISQAILPRNLMGLLQG
jgi:hypothetical protein